MLKRTVCSRAGGGLGDVWDRYGQQNWLVFSAGRLLLTCVNDRLAGIFTL